jgi:hypothetical protein
MMASLFIIFVCMGLFAYWLTRVHVITFHPERMAETLRHDLGLVRNILRSLASRIA